MLTENRFYNYDDALAGIVDHLAKTPSGQIRNLSLLITDGAKPVASYDPEKQEFASAYLESISNLNNPDNRLIFTQEEFNFHAYESERLGLMHFTIVIDCLLTGTAAGMLHIIQDTISRLSNAKGLTVGTVYLFAVEASV